MTDQKIDPALVEAPYPLQEHLGFRMTDWREGFARFELPLEHFLMNRYGIPHGGVHAVMADTAMGYCGCYTGDPENRELAMTLNLSVNYVGPLKGKIRRFPPAGQVIRPATSRRAGYRGFATWGRQTSPWGRPRPCQDWC